MKSLYIVMPAFNEEENIENVIKSWYPLLNNSGVGSRFVVADSGSTDSTHEILLGLKGDYPKLEILSDTLKQHGPKLIALYNYAINKGAEYIFQTDSDGQTVPEEFVQFWEMRGNYDAILGNRIVRGDGIGRKLIENCVCLLLLIFFGIRIKDANAPFRLMKTSLVKKYLHRLHSNYNIPNIMLTTYFSYYNENIAFKEITFKPRQGGKNSINICNIIHIGWNALCEFRQFRKGMKCKS